MSDPGTEALGLVSKGCIYALESLAESGENNAIHSKRRCVNISHQTNATRGLESNNDTENGVDRYSFYAAYMRSLETTPIVLVKSITIVLYSVGVIANILILAYIVKFRRYTSPTFTLIFSLGCCDVGTCACAIVYGVIVMPTLIGPGWLCEYLLWLPAIFYVSSICHIVLFSILRFYQLLFPLISRAKITVALVTKVCICVWLMTIPTSFTVATFQTSGSFIYRGKPYTICVIKAKHEEKVVIFDSVYLVTTNLIIAGFHLVKHVIVLRRSKKKLSEQEHEHRRQATDGRAVTLVIAVFCVTSLSKLLHMYAHFLFGFPIRSFHQVLYQVDINLMIVNSAINPWIYVLAAKSVRHDIMVMLKLK